MRNKYIKELQIGKLSEMFEVHHIDMDRNNNDINNLVALPKKLHQHYHDHFRFISSIESPDINLNIKGLMRGGHASFGYYLEQLTKYKNILTECSKWVDFRDYISGYLPNIHNLSYEGSELRKLI